MTLVSYISTLIEKNVKKKWRRGDQILSIYQILVRSSSILCLENIKGEPTQRHDTNIETKKPIFTFLSKFIFFFGGSGEMTPVQI